MRAKRWFLTAVALVPLVATSCSFHVGCVTYRFFEAGATQPFVTDRSACVAAPPPVVSEVHYPVLLPIAAAIVIAAVWFLVRHRRSLLST